MIKVIREAVDKKATRVAINTASSVATSALEKGLSRFAPGILKRNPVGAIVGLATAIGTKAAKGELTAKNAAGDCVKAGAGWGMAQAGIMAGAMAGPAGMAIGGLLGGAIGVIAGETICKKCDLE